MTSLVSSIKHLRRVNNTPFLNSSPKVRGGKDSNLTFQGQHSQDAKARKRHYKLQAIIKILMFQSKAEHLNVIHHDQGGSHLCTARMV